MSKNFYVSDVITPQMSSEWIFTAISSCPRDKEPRLTIVEDGKTRRIVLSHCSSNMNQQVVDNNAKAWMEGFRKEHPELEPGNAMLDRIAFDKSPKRGFDIGI